MKILTLCSYCVYSCFYKALVDIGNEVIIVELDVIPKINQIMHICTVLDTVRPDLVLTIGRPEVHGLSLEGLNIIHKEFIPPIVGNPSRAIDGLTLECFSELCRERNILHAYWATEDRNYHENYSMKIANCFDLIFTPSNECVEDYKKIGKFAHLMTYGCYPTLHRRVEGVKEYAYDITIAASYHQGLDYDFVRNVINKQENEDEESLRMKSIENIILPIVDKGYSLSIWGNGWEKIVPKKYIKGLLPYEDINKLYSSCKIVLGLEWDNVSDTKTTGRPYEVLGCGAFFLTLRTKALKNIFSEGIHLELTSSKEETVEKIEYYLKNNKEREKIALEGQTEVYKKHTYYHRAGEFINAVKYYANKKNL